MADVHALVRGLGGFAHKRQLVARGARDIDLTRAVRTGEVVRVRRGWYTTERGSPSVRAVRIGGRLTGISAIIAWGGWVLDRHPLHVSVADNAARLRPTGKGVRLHWDSRDLSDRGTATSVSLVDALVRVVLDESLETAVAALDWALHTGRLDRIDFERVLLALPKNRRWIAHWVDERCESLPESLTRTRLRIAGHSVESQVALGAERIDLLIDRLVGLETDGEEFHRDAFERDRRKDLAIIAANYSPLRIPARMVFYEWEAVVSAINQLLHMRGAAIPLTIQRPVSLPPP
ncbi:type IV toxin-antitoxin system AbiEi family antitoxin domain-containing protein [soil metagenome]